MMNKGDIQNLMKQVLSLDESSFTEPTYNESGGIKHVEFTYNNADLVGDGVFKMITPDSYLLTIEYEAFEKYSFVYLANNFMETIFVENDTQTIDILIEYRHHRLDSAELNDGSDTLRLARFKKLPLLYLVNKKKEKRLMFVEDDFFCLR